MYKIQIGLKSSWMCDAVPLGKWFPTCSGSKVPPSSMVKVAVKKTVMGLLDHSAVLRGGGVEGFKPPPKFRRPSKIVPNSTRL